MTLNPLFHSFVLPYPKLKDSNGAGHTLSHFMVIFGSGSIISTFMQHGLIDEYRIIVNPIVLGNGNPLFKGINGKQNLKLLNTKVFDSGIVILFYEPAKIFS